MRTVLAVTAGVLLSLLACATGFALGIWPLSHELDWFTTESLAAAGLAVAAGVALCSAVSRRQFRAAVVLACLALPLLAYAAGRAGYQTSALPQAPSACIGQPSWLAEDSFQLELTAHRRGQGALGLAAGLVVAAVASGAWGLVRASQERRGAPAARRT